MYDWIPRINRNILECKGAWAYNKQIGLLVLIETYWNVKEEFLSRVCIPPTVLIETYWNVKVDRFRRTVEGAAVLIETYWNVKVLSAGGSGAQRWEKYSCLPVF